MKLCWCEQSGLIEDRATLSAALRDNNIDYFRYNWRHGEKDRYANVHALGRLSWSMGRSLLYEQARNGAYDYYIFADDDVVFKGDTPTSLRLLREFLGRYRPLTACVASKNWHDAMRRRIPQRFRGRAHPYLIADLELQIFSDFMANLTFPCIFDGGWKTFWYPNIAVGINAPERQLQFNGVSISNARRNAGGNYGGVGQAQLAEIILAATFNDTTPWWLRYLNKRYGVENSAKFMNAWMSLRNARDVRPLSRRAEISIVRYVDTAREVYRRMSEPKPG